MEIIEISTGMGPGFVPFAIVVGSLALIGVIAGIVIGIIEHDGEIAANIIFPTVLIGGMVVGLGGIGFSGHIEESEKERVKAEVIAVSGVELSDADFEAVLDGDPVRDLYYYKDGSVLIVERGE